jgi:hypothetical protein
MVQLGRIPFNGQLHYMSPLFDGGFSALGAGVYGVCAECVWNVCGVCAECVWNVCGVCVECVWSVC